MPQSSILKSIRASKQVSKQNPVQHRHIYFNISQQRKKIVFIWKKNETSKTLSAIFWYKKMHESQNSVGHHLSCTAETTACWLFMPLVLLYAAVLTYWLAILEPSSSASCNKNILIWFNSLMCRQSKALDLTETFHRTPNAYFYSQKKQRQISLPILQNN